METRKKFKPSTVKDVPVDAFLVAFAAHLKKSGKIELPRHVDLMKTASFKELPPQDLDWFYTRTAAVARRVYMRAGLGLKDFRRAFGGRSFAKGRVMPEHFKLAAGGNIRHSLQQLEKMGIVAMCPDNCGRKMTVEGRRLMDLVARSVPCTRLVVA